MSISWKTNDLCLVAAGALFALIFTFVGLRHAIVSYRHHIFEISESLSHVGKYQRNVQHLPPPTPEAGSHALLNLKFSDQSHRCKPCRYGELAGVFLGGFWNLYPHECPSCKVRQFFEHNNREKILCKTQGSVLIIGDSVDRDAVFRTCDFFRTPMRKYIEPSQNLSGKNSYSYCVIESLNISIAQFMHFGVFKPPYWKYAYPIPKELHEDNYEHIKFDTHKYTRLLRDSSPTIVIFQSYLWDLAREWQLVGKEKEGWLPQAHFVQRWYHAVKELVRVIKTTFPQSKLIWRTAPPPTTGDSGRSPEIIHSMNELVKSYARSINLEYIDFGTMLQGISPQKVHNTHPSREASLAYVNLVLNYLNDICSESE